MKRFLLFAGSYYYPAGGVDDFHGDYNSIGEAYERWVKNGKKG